MRCDAYSYDERDLSLIHRGWETTRAGLVCAFERESESPGWAVFLRER